MHLALQYLRMSLVGAIGHNEPEELSREEMLPGFVCRISELFPDP